MSGSLGSQDFTASALSTSTWTYGGLDYNDAIVGGLYGQSWGLPSSSSNNTNYAARAAIATSAQGIRLIDDEYANILLRAPTSAELTAQQNALTRGASFDDILYYLSHLAEASSAIARVFSDILQRAPSSGESAGWLDAIQHRDSLADTRHSLAFGKEAQGLINGIYQDVLGRGTDSVGLSSNQSALAAGETMAQVRTGTAHSAEAGSDINNLYQQCFGVSGADPGGLAAYENLLGQPGQTLQTIKVQLAHNAGSNINALYQQCFGTDADSGGLTAYENLLGQPGQTLQTIKAQLAQNAGSNINSLYQQCFGTNADPGGLTAYENLLAQPGQTLQTLKVTLAQNAGTNIDALSTSILGRNLSSSELSGFEGILGQTGQTLNTLRVVMADTPEASADVSSAFSDMTGSDVDTVTLSSIVSSIETGATITGSGILIIATPTFQNELSLYVGQSSGVTATDDQLSSISGELVSALISAGSTTWSNLGTALLSGLHKLWNEVNPVGTAIAATISTPAQQAANLAAAKALVADKNVMAFLHTIAAAEHAGTFDPSTAYNSLYGGGSIDSLAAFPTSKAKIATAGAYQMQESTWREEANRLGLNDWSATTQDLMAADYLARFGGTAALASNQLATAIGIAATKWAAVPLSATENHSYFKYTRGKNVGHYQPSMDYQTFVSTYNTFKAEQ